MRSVGVDEDDDVAGGLRQREPDRVALTFAVILNHARAVRLRDLARAIGRVAVDDQHLVAVGPDRVDDLSDQSFFVPGRNANRYTGSRHRNWELSARGLSESWPGSVTVTAGPNYYIALA